MTKEKFTEIMFNLFDQRRICYNDINNIEKAPEGHNWYEYMVQVDKAIHAYIDEFAKTKWE